MKIFIPMESKQTLGGGWTWIRTFTKFSKDWATITHNQEEKHDLCLIAGVTQTSRETIIREKENKIPIVLRIDNIPRNSRNRNTGTSRLYDFAQWADLVVYQSSWAKRYIMPFIKKDGPVIINGADETIFRPEGEKIRKDGEPQYLYSRFNRDETKRWELAWYQYILIQRKNPNAHLWIVGNFSFEHLEYNFDFFQGERYKYWGIIDNPELLAQIYRSADYLMYTYWNDACSQTLIECLLCGIEPIYYELSGGAKEIKESFEKYGREYLMATRMCKEYKEALEGVIR
uniref:Glycosyltransferase family 1 protein n=1 Tax=Caldisericum exile TaxID=693075 RepID=A0A7C4TYC1_9BACT